jgi:uncharacterized protein DUF4192
MQFPHASDADSNPDHDNQSLNPENDQFTTFQRLQDTSHLLHAIPYLLRTPPTPPGIAVLAHRETQVVTTRFIRLPSSGFTPGRASLAGAWRALDVMSGAQRLTGVSIIAYTDASWTDAIHDFAAAAPVEVLELVRVHEGKWYALHWPDAGDCRRPGCSPHGVALDRPGYSEPSGEDDAVDLAGADAVVEAIKPTPANVRAAVHAGLQKPCHLNQQSLFDAVVQARQAQMERQMALATDEAAVLVHALADATVRDACLAWDDDAARRLWFEIIRVAPLGWLAAPATMLAVLAYRQGHIKTAEKAIQLARIDGPDYQLATLVEEFIDADIPPSTDPAPAHTRPETQTGPEDE